jgi:hypothetical protein
MKVLQRVQKLSMRIKELQSQVSECDQRKKIAFMNLRNAMSALDADLDNLESVTGTSVSLRASCHAHSPLSQKSVT